MFIFFLIPVVLIIICAFKESKVTSVYKTFKVYGRVYAYLTTTFLLMPVMALVGIVISIVISASEGASDYVISSLMGFIVMGVVGCVVGIVLYKRAKSKCPVFLRKKLLTSILTTGLGVGVKICLFFLPFVWSLTAPKEVTLGNGRRGFIHGNEVYDKDGNHIGTVAGPNEFTPNRNYPRDNY